jgi:hypothetical protein
MLFLIASALVAEEKTECTHDIDISCIQTFHEAMAPSCHKYVPENDFATVRKHVPNMLAQAKLIAAFQPDSTYTDVMEEFDQKRKVFLTSIDELKIAADGDDDAALKKAFDSMHEAFARMSGSLTMTPQELDDFHSVLAKVWHDYLPEKDYAAIEKAIPELKEGCARLMSAKLHTSRQNIKKEYLEAVKGIRASIDSIEKVIGSDSDEKISQAIESLHESFNEVAVLF